MPPLFFVYLKHRRAIGIGEFIMSPEIETKMNAWLSIERGSENPLDLGRFYDFVATCVGKNEKVEQAAYDEKIEAFMRNNYCLTNEWSNKYDYSLFEKLYYFGLHLRK